MKLLNTDNGKIIISIIWGLGLALLFFRQTCEGPDCVMVKAPSKDIENNTYLHDSRCYQYKPYSVKCTKKPIRH